MDEQTLILIEKYLSGKCSPDESQRVEEWYDRRQLPEWLGEDTPHAERAVSDIYARIRSTIQKKRNRRRTLWQLGAAAAILLMLGTVLCVYMAKSGKQREGQTAGLPGSNKAVLILANGSQVVLNDSRNGSLARQGATQIIKLNNGSLVYNGKEAKGADKDLYNTIRTPRGGQFRVVLPDGSSVWLNAASSVHFPVVFSGKERVVEVAGEAYFEVVHDTAMPFIVKAGNAEIKDIGTHFNVYAYDDEAVMKTTLLEGAIRINTRLGSSVLKPGQQAQINKNETIKIVQVPDFKGVAAWKDGLLNFSSTDVAALLRQIGRWYNIDVEVRGAISNDHITGTIPRSTDFSGVIKILELNNLKCNYQAGKLIVSQ